MTAHNPQASAVPSVPLSPPGDPHSAIATCAHLKWKRHGCPSDSQLRDWFEAEAEMDLVDRLWAKEERLQIALKAAGMGVWEWNLLTDAVNWSSSLETLHGLVPGTFPGTMAAFIELVHPDDRELVRQVCADAVQSGNLQRLEYRIVWPDGSVHWVEGRGQAYFDADGKPVRILGVRMDINARKQAERRQATERAVANTLVECPSLKAVAPRIIESICACLGWDFGAVWTVDRAAQLLRCVATWHTPSLQVPEFEAMTQQRAFPIGVGMPGRVWASGKAAWIPDATRDDNFPRAAIAKREGLHGAVGFPIGNGIEFLGMIEFFSRRIQPLDQDLLAMMTSIGAQISQFIERQQVERTLHEREHALNIAREIQQGLYPARAPSISGFDIAGAARPAQETGGDYFDFLRLADGRLGLMIGDASGHGIGPALLMVETRAYARALALNYSDAGDILAHLNRCLCADMKCDFFVTLLLARLDPAARSLDYCNAGHCPAHILDRHGAVRAELPATSIPLGLDAAAKYATVPGVSLQPGDLIFLFTDGILDAGVPHRSAFRLQPALDIVRAHRDKPAEQIVNALFHAVEQWSPGPSFDDMTAVIVKVQETHPEVGRA